MKPCVERQRPVRYERFPEVELGYIPVIDEGEPSPEPEHYEEAARLDRAWAMERPDENQ